MYAHFLFSSLHFMSPSSEDIKVPDASTMEISHPAKPENNDVAVLPAIDSQKNDARAKIIHTYDYSDEPYFER